MNDNGLVIEPADNELGLSEAEREGRRQFCTFVLDQMLLGVDLHHVREVMDPQPMTMVPLGPALVCGLINLRGTIVPAIDLRAALGLPSVDSERSRRLMSVIVYTPLGLMGLQVDLVRDIQDVAEDLFEPPPVMSRGLSAELIDGAYRIPGQLLIRLNIAILADRVGRQPTL